MRLAERRARTFAKRQLGDSPLRARMTPEYRMGCKRVLLSNDFLPALASPRVDLVSDRHRPGRRPPGSSPPMAIERPLDVLILATGFRAADPFGPLRILGADGVEARDGPRAFLGLALPGCPNLFLVGGPNTGSRPQLGRLHAGGADRPRPAAAAPTAPLRRADDGDRPRRRRAVQRRARPADAAHGLAVGLPQLVFGRAWAATRRCGRGSASASGCATGGAGDGIGGWGGEGGALPRTPLGALPPETPHQGCGPGRAFRGVRCGTGGCGSGAAASRLGVPSTTRGAGRSPVFLASSK